MSREQRQELIDWKREELSVSSQADLLSLNRSSLYYRKVAPSAEEVALKHRIDEIYTAHPYYGSRRIAAHLRAEGWCVNRKAVQRHMHEMGIMAIYPGPNLSKRAYKQAIFPYLLGGMSIAAPNQVWGIDITYIRMQSGWMYLVALLDWYSRYVVSWEIDQTLGMSFVLEAVQRALQVARPTICNSDQGSHFTSLAYREVLQSHDVQISMDGRGRALDNIFVERLWRSVKYEEIYLKEYQSPREVRAGLTAYFHFYNHERVHQALKYLTPAQVYWGEM